MRADSSGVAKIEFSDNLIPLYGENSIIGRSLVVHAQEDDLGGFRTDSTLNFFVFDACVLENVKIKLKNPAFLKIRRHCRRKN